jgi:hypothetical protein
MHIPRKMTDVLPAAETRRVPPLVIMNLATLRHGFIHPDNHGGPSHPQMRRFATADAQDIHDKVRALKKKVMKKE